MNKYYFPLLIIIGFYLQAFSSFWEYIGPDTVSFTAAYNWGNGHIISATHITGVGKRRPLYVTRNFGKTWDTLCMGGGLQRYKVENFAKINNRLYACLHNSSDVKQDTINSETFFFSEDSGATWHCAPDFPGQRSYWALGKDSIIVVGNSYHVSRSTDFGQSWKEVEVKDGSGGVSTCYSVAMYNDTMYVGCHKGLWVSKDWGETWENRGLGVFTISTIHFIGKILFNAVQVGIQYHTDFGNTSQSWITSIVTDHATKVFPVKDSIAYATVNYSLSTSETVCELYESKDTAKTFERFWIEDDTTIVPLVNRFESGDKYVFALTKKGMYRKLIYDDTTIKQKGGEYSITSFTAYRLYNNTIHLDLEKQSEISLSLFSLNGRLVQKVFNGKKSSGTHRFRINNSYLSNNVYCLQASVNGRQYSRLVRIFK